MAKKDPIADLETQIAMLVAEAAVTTTGKALKESELLLIDNKDVLLMQEGEAAGKHRERLRAAVVATKAAHDEATAKADESLERMRFDAGMAVALGCSTAQQQIAVAGGAPYGHFDKVLEAQDALQQACRALVNTEDPTQVLEAQRQGLLGPKLALLGAVQAADNHLAALRKKVQHMGTHLAAMKAAAAGATP